MVFELNGYPQRAFGEITLSKKGQEGLRFSFGLSTATRTFAFKPMGPLQTGFPMDSVLVHDGKMAALTYLVVGMLQLGPTAY